MTARKSGSRLETEIERCRSEGQWDKIPELVRQLSAKLISNDDLGELLLGEAKLQQYIKENPIKQGASPRGPRPRLQEVRKHLTAALDRGNLKPEYMQEASLIMAKLCYVEGDYREALNQYSRVNLDEMQLVGAPVYRLSTIAEAYATKGLCLEKVPMASPSLSNRNADRDQEIITCYEKSGDIALLYLQEVEKALSVGIQNRSPKPGPVTQEQELGYFLETGLQRAHVIHFKNGNLTRGVGRFREILRAVETRTTQNLRMTIARQLAEILLRGMCEQSYWNPRNFGPQGLELPTPEDKDETVKKCKNTKNVYASILGHRHVIHAAYFEYSIFENTEEALLLLLISESMANRDAVLSRIPEHNNDRIISLQSASLVYDLLTIALGRRGQYEMLSECLERAMKFAFEEFHLWFQLALSLMAAGKSARAVKVLKECMRLKPDDPTIPLLAVKLCIGNLHWLEEGERFAKIVIDMGEKAAEFRAKGCLAIGLVYSLRATDASLRGMQEEYQKKALSAFQRAQSLSPTDHLAVFYLALQLAVSRQIPEALGYVRQALQLQGDDVHSLHLLALLLSAQKHYHDALNIIEMALSEYPENFIALLLNAMTLPDFSDPETGNLPDAFFHGFDSFIGVCSVHATSIAASRVEQALSEVASSLQSSAPKQGPLHPWMTLAQIWLHAAEVYIGMGKAAEATACTQEAANLFPMSRNVLFMKGQVAELRGNVDEAKRWYEEALSISPTHVKTMQRLVSTCCLVNSTAHDVWNSLGEVLQAQGNDAAATECFLTALELEASCPILPFTIIPRTL
uniref:Tetratricopeptide repeat protein 7B-like n=1 Tax=Sinocyclocheilus rhinocerous TaxID=307959 RepID=A0A673LU15_9TELE